jgi:hypothetical protein
MIETPPDEIESTEEFVMGDEDVTREADWDQDNHVVPPPQEKRVVSCIPARSHINIFTETPEVYESLRTSHDILADGWDSMKYGRVPQRIELIQTMCMCGCDIEVQEIDESDECSCIKMRSLGIRLGDHAPRLSTNL